MAAPFLLSGRHAGGTIEHRHERIVRVYLPHKARDPILKGALIGRNDEGDEEDGA